MSDQKDMGDEPIGFDASLQIDKRVNNVEMDVLAAPFFAIVVFQEGEEVLIEESTVAEFEEFEGSEQHQRTAELTGHVPRILLLPIDALHDGTAGVVDGPSDGVDLIQTDIAVEQKGQAIQVELLEPLM